MGKNDFLTPKAIANRIKAKGLNKLRWYCQLCQKSCRDENGFKCHQMSEGHRRQMEVFGQNPDRVVDGFSEEFESSFMDHLRRAHPASRVSAKNVYNEFIADRHHIHMNSTKWLTLTEFVKHLGRTGQCKVEETEKGWFITLIRVDPAKAVSDAEKLKRERMEEEEEERNQRLLLQQVERARKMARTDQDDAAEAAARELQRSEADEPIKLSLTASTAAAAAGDSKAAAARPAPKAAAPLFEEDEDAGPSGGQQHRKLSKVEELMQKDLEEKKRRAAAAGPSSNGRAAANTAAGTAPGGSSSGSKGRLDHWLYEGIVVKVLSKQLKDYYKKKGVVEQVLDTYTGELSMTDSGDVIRIDQAELETVLPAPGGKVLVVNGPYRGIKGTLKRIDTNRYQAQVQLRGSQYDGKEVWLDYEDVCKLA